MLFEFIRLKAKAVPLHAMKTLGRERRYSSYSFLTSVLHGPASCPGRALAPGKGPWYPLNWRLGGPRSSSEHRLEEKSFRLCRGSNLDRPVVQSVARHCTD
jgi:hypothetical protein